MVAFGQGFEQLAVRLKKGSQVFVQGELTIREYDRTINIPNGKKPIEHVISQIVLELKADTIRLLDRAAAQEPSDAAGPPMEKPNTAYEYASALSRKRAPSYALPSLPAVQGISLQQALILGIKKDENLFSL